MKNNKNINDYKMIHKFYQFENIVADYYMWKDNENIVAEFKTFSWWDGLYIADFEINKKYRGNKYSYQLLDFATELGVTHLTVEKNNNIALYIYKKYGYKIIDQDDKYFFMELKKERLKNG